MADSLATGAANCPLCRTFVTCVGASTDIVLAGKCPVCGIAVVCANLPKQHAFGRPGEPLASTVGGVTFHEEPAPADAPLPLSQHDLMTTPLVDERDLDDAIEGAPEDEPAEDDDELPAAASAGLNLHLVEVARG